MSFVIAVPEMVTDAATSLAGVGSTNDSAYGAAAPTTGVMAAADDEVSAAIATLFSRHASAYQALSPQVAAFHGQFVQTLRSGGAAYGGTEAANVEQVLLGAVQPFLQQTQPLRQALLGVINAPFDFLLGRPLIGPGTNGTTNAQGVGTPGGAGGLLWGRGGSGGNSTAIGAAGGASGPAGLLGAGGSGGAGGWGAAGGSGGVGGWLYGLGGPRRYGRTRRTRRKPVAARCCSAKAEPVGWAGKARPGVPVAVAGGWSAPAGPAGPGGSPSRPAVPAAPGASFMARPGPRALPVPQRPSPCKYHSWRVEFARDCDTGSQGILVPEQDVNTANLGKATGMGLTIPYGLSGSQRTYTYSTYTVPVNFTGTGIVTAPTTIGVITAVTSNNTTYTWNGTEYANGSTPLTDVIVGKFGIGADTPYWVGQNPSPSNPPPPPPPAGNASPVLALPGTLNQGVLINAPGINGSGGELQFGANPLTPFASLPGAPLATTLQVQITASGTPGNLVPPTTGGISIAVV